MLIIGLDDTDILETRGTGHLARQIAADLARDYRVQGVVRHQLLRDPRVPCTKNNSSAAILLKGAGPARAQAVFERVRALMLADFIAGSDPGLCVAAAVPQAIVEFGRLAQRELVTQRMARDLAAKHGLALVGLGGTEGGVIGALAAAGLAASGNDGRYVLVGRLRELAGLQPVAVVLDAGIAAVRTLQGEPVAEGLVQTDKLRPARRGGRPIAVVEWAGSHWAPLKLD